MFEEDDFRDVHRDTDKGLHPPSQLSQLDILNLLEDEDELEYDIVNIDKDLLRLPRLFTSEDLLERQRLIILFRHQLILYYYMIHCIVSSYFIYAYFEPQHLIINKQGL